MKIHCYIIAILFLMPFTSCQSDNTNPEVPPEGYALDSIFPIENIASISVSNFNGTHKLNPKELNVLKNQLKKAQFSGGLLIKPGHISLSIQLKNKDIIKTGYVYGSTGCIHFDGGIDQFNQPFSGTFYLPTKLNFDN